MSDADFSVYATIKANTAQFEKGMKNAQTSINSMSKSIEGVQKLLKTAFSVVGVTVGIKAVTDFGKSCVQSANQAVKTFNILDNTVKATGADAWTSIGELENASKALSDSTNYSVTEIQKMQSVLLGFTNITGEAFDGASEAVLDMATVMGMDLTSAVQTVGKALDDPITGLDSLRRQGFKFTDEQKAELAQLVRNGKQFEAQKIILDTLSTSYGGAAKAGQDSFAKQRHAIENFQDALGGKLIPVMQVFAENNAKMINSLRELIENMDFTPVVNVVTNLKKIFTEAFNTISGYLQNVGDYVSDFISRFNFKPIISILDTLIGVIAGIISKFKEINSQKLEIFDKLKEALIEFSNSETFQNIVNFVNNIIDAVFFLWSEIQNIGTEIRDLVVNKIIEIWGKIKELFQNGQNALSESGQDIASWGDLFYNILNNTFRSFQDFFGMIKALIHGDWTVAWEYAKLTVMRVADNILDLISTIANAFPNLINGMINELNNLITEINKVRGWFGKDPLGLISAFESVDLSKKSGLEDKIKEPESKIQELTGKAADITIQNLEGISTKFAGFTQNSLGEIENLTKGVTTNSKKQKEYFSSSLSSTEKDFKSTYKKFKETMKKTLEVIRIIANGFNNALKGIVKGFSTAFNTIGNIISKNGNLIKNAVSGIFSIIKKLVRFSIDDALDSLLEFEDGILTFFVETLPKLPQFIESAFGSVISLLETLDSVIDFDKLESDLSSMINTISNELPQAFESALNILVGETDETGETDKIGLLTALSNAIEKNAPEIVNAFGSMFFTVAEALPGIIDNLFATIGSLLSELGKYLTENKDRFETALKNIISSIVNGMSEFVKNGGLKNLLDGLLAVQQAIEEAVVDNIDEIAEFISEALPDIMKFLKDSIISASKTLGQLAPTLLKSLGELIGAIFAVAFDPDVIESSFDAISGIISGLIQGIVEFVIKIIPALIEALVAAPKFIPELIGGILSGIIDGFATADWWGICEACFNGLIEGFKDLFGIHSPSTLFEGFGENIIEGLKIGLDGFGDTLETVMKPLVTFVDNLTNMQKIGEGIKSMFEGIAEVVKISGKVTVGVMAAIANAIVDIHNTLRDIIKSVTTLKVKTPWKTYEIGGVDIGKVDKIDMSQYTAIMDAMDNQSGGNQSVSATGSSDAKGIFDPKGILAQSIAAAKSYNETRAYASGTMSARRGLALVGEAGPELVNFRGGEQVLNAHNTQKALDGMGGSTNNFNVVFNNTQDTTAFAMMQQLKAYNRQLAINGVL